MKRWHLSRNLNKGRELDIQMAREKVSQAVERVNAKILRWECAWNV